MMPVTLPRGVSPSWPSHAECSRPEGPAGHRGNGAIGLFRLALSVGHKLRDKGPPRGRATERGVQRGGSQASHQRPAPMFPGYAPLGSGPRSRTGAHLLGRQLGNQPAWPRIPTFLPPRNRGRAEMVTVAAHCYMLGADPCLHRGLSQHLTANPGDSWKPSLGRSHTLGLQVHLADRGTHQPRGCLGKSSGPRASHGDTTPLLASVSLVCKMKELG